MVNIKHQGLAALGNRLMSIAARIRTERNLGRWKRVQHIPVQIGSQLPVIVCTWRRIERLPRTLELLAAQDVPVQACIWNNSPERDRVDAAAARAGIPVSVYHSPRNIGGFGRFYLARQAGMPDILQLSSSTTTRTSRRLL